MALSASDLAAVERWTGDVDDADHDSIQARIDRLGSAEAASLELLMIERARMRKAATKVGSGRYSSDHTENLKAMTEAIAELVAAIDPDDLTEAGEELVEEATVQSYSTEITVEASAKRRG